MLENFKTNAVKLFDSEFEITELPENEYTNMKWPKFLPLMRFHVDRYRVKGFGQIMFMHTNAMMGMMQLMTASFMPYEGVEAPFLLIDMMTMKDKRTVFVEFYDCTKNGVSASALDNVAASYSDISDYDEKPAWYVSERMPSSMIKGGTSKDEERLCEMALRATEEYVRLAKTAPTDKENLTGLEKFAGRMLSEGNPSSGTMSKVLGEKGAEEFFSSTVMPMHE